MSGVLIANIAGFYLVGIILSSFFILDDDSDFLDLMLFPIFWIKALIKLCITVIKRIFKLLTTW